MFQGLEPFILKWKGLEKLEKASQIFLYDDFLVQNGFKICCFQYFFRQNCF